MSAQKHETIGALSTRLNAARWVLWGSALLAALGIVLHFLLAWSGDASVNWLYQALTLGIVIVALFSLRWLERSLSQAMQFAAWVSMFGVLGMVWMVYGILVFLVWLFLIVKAYSGQKFKIPVLGDWVEEITK